MIKKPTTATISVQGTEIAVIRHRNEDYISLTDIAKSKNAEHPDDLIRNWLRNRNTLELLGIWEQLHNPGFNPVEFDGFKMQAGPNWKTFQPQIAQISADVESCQNHLRPSASSAVNLQAGGEA